jgi:hypothetical protein
LLSTIGIFDTFGYANYESSHQLTEILQKVGNLDPLVTNYPKDNKNPVYIVELPRKNDAQTRIISRIKKARLRYRSFNPQEHIRLSGTAAIQHVASSSGVVVPIAADHVDGAAIHNIRAAFVAGLATALNRPLLLLQDFDGPAPLDVRDYVKTFQQVSDINRFVGFFAGEVIEEMQASVSQIDEERAPLTGLVLGDPMAENEMTTLGQYYLTTEEYLRVSRGEANMVVGRKGMGKTALFIQLRDRTRKDIRNVVVDLKPEGYQLKKLREDLLDILTEGSVEHLVVAFWEFLLYVEIANKLLEKDVKKIAHDQHLSTLYRKLETVQKKVKLSEEADFSERLQILVDEILRDIDKFSLSKEHSNRISTANITEIIHSYSLPELRENVSEYLLEKESLWILFDNLDKGWPVQGIDKTDATILRCLIDAGKKVKRELTKKKISAHSVIFVRNDVYQILMQNTADFGKEIRVQLDWSDRDLMREMVKKRLGSEKESFEQVWERFFVRLYRGEYSFDYLLDRCLMRPRNIIKLMFHARGYAINMRHDKILEDDLEKALSIYSNDVLEEADEELTDIEPSARGLIYRFIGEPARLDRDRLLAIISTHGSETLTTEKTVEYLLYFGFFGVLTPQTEARFIYNFQYNITLMNAWIDKNKDSITYYLNPAFWPALEVHGVEA